MAALPAGTVTRWSSTTAPVLEYGKDEMQIGMKMLAIMLGGGNRPSESTED